LRNALLARALQKLLDHREHLAVADPPRDLREHPVVPNGVEGTYDTLPVISTSPRTSLLSALAIRSTADRSTCSVRCIGKVGYFSF
jgi:hypothetical protein